MYYDLVCARDVQVCDGTLEADVGEHKWKTLFTPINVILMRNDTASFKKLYPYVICKKSFPFSITDFVNILHCWNVIIVI